ncbi:MAG: T9SS type A sorting domain-containing protein, partial [Flavobacteriales bacterium]|nr:T9SS type A sorting domain-containing protein [Flavobacteriales bacterium]
EMFIMGIFYVLDTAGLSVVGISETESGPGVVAVYPNPASTAVYFETDKQLNGNLTIYNSMGILVDEFRLKGGPREMDVSTLSSGVYFYRIQSEEGIQSGPFTIAH